MMLLNLKVAWLCFLLGCFAGAVPGLFFYHPEWLGGYASWRRRMIRLAHIAFFGLGFMNLGYALTCQSLPDLFNSYAGIAFIVAAIAMPLICYLAAWRSSFRHLFFIPVVSLLTAICITLGKVVVL